MIILTILLACIAAIIVVGLIATFIAAGSIIAMFGDLIVLGLIVWAIIAIVVRLSRKN